MRLLLVLVPLWILIGCASHQGVTEIRPVKSLSRFADLRIETMRSRPGWASHDRAVQEALIGTIRKKRLFSSVVPKPVGHREASEHGNALILRTRLKERSAGEIVLQGSLVTEKGQEFGRFEVEGEATANVASYIADYLAKKRGR